MNQKLWIRILPTLACILALLIAGCSINPPDTKKNTPESSTQPDAEDKDNAQPDQQGNAPPVAIVGPDRSVVIIEAEDVPLDGTGSFDPEDQSLTYYWYCSDDSVSFPEGNDTAQPNVTLPQSGIYIFVLVVSDGVHTSEPAFLTITVDEPDAWVDSELPEDNPSQNRYRSLQGAIDAVADEPGSLIAVDHGPYTEQVNVPNGIWLYGLLQDDGQRPLVQYAAKENEAVVVLQSYAAVHNLNITCNDDDENSTMNPTEAAAIMVQGVRAEIARCQIKNSWSDGIKLSDNSSAIISEVELNTIAGEGLVVGTTSSVWLSNSRILETGGSGIWAFGADHVELDNNVIYNAGWHGIDADNCDTVLADHCSIIQFGHVEDLQDGLKITNGREIVVNNNLIVIGNYETLSGINIIQNARDNDPDIYHNYLYSTQPAPNYYNGMSVDDTNTPSGDGFRSEDPLLMAPEEGIFGLASGSPAVGAALNNENCGAQGVVLIPVIR